MTKVHRIVLVVVDNDDIGADGVKRVLESARYPNHCIAPQVMACETREVEWHDRHPLNLEGQQRQAFEELFGDTPRVIFPGHPSPDGPTAPSTDRDKVQIAPMPVAPGGR